MADYRYGNDRGRGSSIFSDDDNDRWRSRDQSGSRNLGRSQEYDRGRDLGGQEDDRGFFDRAGDEVRSWFGDEEAERRREMDARRYEGEHGQSGDWRRHEDQWTNRSTSGRDDRRFHSSQPRSNQGGYGSSSFGQSGSRSQSGSFRPQGGYDQGSGQGTRQMGGYNSSSYGQGGYGEGGFGGYESSSGQSRQDSGRSFGQFGQEHGQSGSGSGHGGLRFGQSGQVLGSADRGFGQGSQGSSHHDDSYRRWRDQQIAKLDSEYDEYCRHRQQQFEQDFSSFRQSRAGQSGQMSGQTDSLTGSGSLGSSSGSEPLGQNAGATTSGAGAASAASSSTGSSVTPTEMSETDASGGTKSKSR